MPRSVRQARWVLKGLNTYHLQFLVPGNHFLSPRAAESFLLWEPV